MRNKEIRILSVDRTDGFFIDGETFVSPKIIGNELKKKKKEDVPTLEGIGACLNCWNVSSY